MRSRLFTLGALVCWAAGLAAPARADDPVDVLPARGFAKAQQPQAAVGPGGKVYVTFGAENVVYCVVSEDGGKNWKPPVKVGEAGALALGMRRGPRVAATDKAVVVTAVGGKLGKGRDEDLLAWRSEDGGVNWKGPATINSVTASAREGLHHTVAAPDGTFYTIWLDLRAKRTQVYGASSRDGETWRDEKLVYESPDGSVCECCQPQAAYDAKGVLYVMWRNSLAGARDMYVTRSEDNGKTFGKAAKLGRGTWPLKACPMDGGGLAATADGDLLTVWRRDREVYRCAPGQAEASLGHGEQPWAAAGPGGVYLVWVTGRPGVVMALKPGAERPTRLAERGWDPVVAAPVKGEGPVVVVWEEGQPGAKRLRALTLSPTR
jgi:hypothetical protein